MALTREEIIAGAAYTVRFEYGSLSAKRFRDAVKLVKELNKKEGTSSRYDADAKTWHVELPDDSLHGLADLRTLAYIYNAEVERV